LKKNVKVIASLVRKAKKKLYQGKRDEALELMRKAVNIDDNNGVLIQVIKVIGKKKIKTDYEEEDGQEYSVDDAEEAAAGNLEEAGSEDVMDIGPEQDAETVEEVAEEAEPEQQHERKPSMAPEETLQKLFEASDMEYENGHQQKAIAYLRKARKLAPESPEVLERIELLKTRIKSENLVQIARKKLESGEPAKAVVLAREAFDMLPYAKGLDDLLADLEAVSDEIGGHEEPVHPVAEPPEKTGTAKVAAQEYISQIRQMVQDNSLVAAAELAERANSVHPDDSLLSEFVENFKKLGLLE